MPIGLRPLTSAKSLIDPAKYKPCIFAGFMLETALPELPTGLLRIIRRGPAHDNVTRLFLRTRSRLAAALALACILPAHADRDTVQFGNNINVTPGNPVHDAVCFFCSVRVEGKVNGDIVVFFGSVHLAGDAHHDVVNFFGNVTADDNSSIDGDMVSFFGSVRLGENVTVGKDLWPSSVPCTRPHPSAAVETACVQPGWIVSLPPADPRV